ncbi:sensor histidine kinase [Candidatus Magnetomonas plexicatena]|uniref:sensor histidine kinase n=1 Tax=Candidatus Magnetomonas plexicatena TaxID=2552947 RepID=UPI0010FFF14B|nr:ATP-binding protein [Nitrospirales bacterium LBB_01]
MKTYNKITALLAICLFLVVLQGKTHASTRSGQYEKHVLLLNSYNKGYLWTDNQVMGVESLFKEKDDFTLHVEYMDTKRIKSAEYYKILSELFSHKYKRIHFEVIIITDDDALDFVKEYREELFKDIPFVFCGINDYTPAKTEGFKNFTGVNEGADYEATLEVALKLNPGLKHAVVISDMMTTGILEKKSFNDSIGKYKQTINFTYLDNSTMDEVKQYVSKLTPDTAVFYLSFFKDRNGEDFSPSTAVTQITEASLVPVYGGVDYMLRYGIIGGMLKNSFYQGETAGKLALKILNGEKADDIPVIMKSPNKFMFDYNVLQRFDIDASSLPAGATVINKPETFYFKYKRIIWAVTVLIAGLVIFIVVLLVNIQQRIKAQNELVKYQNHLEDLVTERTRELKNAHQQLVESEKMAALGGLVAGVAHEINTPVGIAVTAASHLQDVTSKLSEAINNKTAKKDELFNYFTHATKSSELILTNLERTSELVKSFKLVSADQTSHEMRLFNVRDYIEKVITSLSPKLKHTSVEIKLECPPDIEINSYPGALAQIITNFIMNSLMHAYNETGKGAITIEISKSDDSFTLKYSDDGKGIPEENLSKIFNPFFTTNRAGGGTGLGLHILYNLITQTFKGTINCESIVGKGTTFTVTIPAN